MRTDDSNTACAVHAGSKPLATSNSLYVTSRRERKKIEMLFAHLKRILRLDRLRLRGPFGAQDEFLLAATVQNLRKMAKPAARPNACLSTKALTRACLLATSRTVKPQTFSTKSANRRHQSRVNAGLWEPHFLRRPG